MNDEMAERLFVAVVVLIGMLIWYIIKTNIERESLAQLEQNIIQMGYGADNIISIPMIKEMSCPGYILIDSKNKKWFCVRNKNSREIHKNTKDLIAYGFSEIENYNVKIQTKNTKYARGKTMEFNAEHYTENGILNSLCIRPDDYAYIEINIHLRKGTFCPFPMDFIMYAENFGDKKEFENFSSESIKSAMVLENWLCKVVKERKN